MIAKTVLATVMSILVAASATQEKDSAPKEKPPASEEFKIQFTFKGEHRPTAGMGAAGDEAWSFKVTGTTTHTQQNFADLLPKEIGRRPRLRRRRV